MLEDGTMIQRSKIDIFLEKLISRKLLVLVITVMFLWFGKLDGTQFVEISMTYIGSQAIVDAATGFSKGTSDANSTLSTS